MELEESINFFLYSLIRPAFPYSCAQIEIRMFLLWFVCKSGFCSQERFAAIFHVFSWLGDVHGNRPRCTPSVYRDYPSAAFAVRCFCYAAVGGCSCCTPYCTNCYHVYWHRENNVWKVHVIIFFFYILPHSFKWLCSRPCQLGFCFFCFCLICDTRIFIWLWSRINWIF